MKFINHEQGSSLVMFTVFSGLIISLAMAGILLASSKLGNEAQMLRSLNLTKGIIEQLGVETLQAHRTYVLNSNTCPATGYTTYMGFGGEGGFCFPDPFCLQDPNDDTILLCSNDTPSMFELIPAGAGMTAGLESSPRKMNKSFHAHNILKFIKNKISYFQTDIVAQGSLNEDFLPANAVPSLLDQSCSGTLCKECRTPANTGDADTIPCVRFRICPKYAICDDGNNLEWVVQKIGVLESPPSP